ncbi:MAG: SurA N-terminal domain-containing protein [Halothiobacillaceae bacterium]
MLMDLREKISGWIAYTIVGLITIPFVLWGVGEYFQGGQAQPLATINGQEISQSAFDQAYEQERQRIAQQFGGTISPEMLEGLGIKQQVLNGLVMREVLSQYAQANGLRVSDAELAGLLRSIPAFQENGQFSQARYEQVLRNQGQVPQSFEPLVRLDLVVGQLQSGIAQSAFVTEADVDSYVRLRDQLRELEVYLLPKAERLATIKPDEAALEAYFAAHQADFRRPERVRVEKLELSVENLAQLMKPSEEDVRVAYEAYVEAQKQLEAREARHILIAVEPGSDDAVARKTIENLRQRVDNGEDFSKLAQDFSQDPGSAKEGGKLGLVTRGMMVEPFEKALFALPKVGAISEPVRSPFGWHLIALDGIKPVTPKPLDEVRAQMEQDARLAMAEAQFHDYADRLATLSYEHPDSLLPAAEQLGLSVTKSDWLQRGQAGENAKLLQAAFSEDVLKQGRNSEVLDLGNQQAVVVRLLEHEDAADQPFASVRAEVEKRLVEQELTKAMQTEAESVRLALAQAGEVAAPAGAERTFTGAIKRQSREVEADIARAAFAMQPPAAGGVSTEALRLPSGDYAVLRLLSVKPGEPSLVTADERKRLLQELRRNQAMNDNAVFDAYLRAKAEITQRQDI